MTCDVFGCDNKEEYEVKIYRVGKSFHDEIRYVCWEHRFKEEKK